MAQTRNTAIGCIAVVLLIGTIGACGIAEKAEQEGVEFGKRADQRGCQDEAFRRLRAALRRNDIFKHRESLFLYGCFQTCRATPNFCATAPKENAFLSNLKWSHAQCEKEGLGDEDACADLFMEVSDTCLGKTPRREK